ncbi:MAG: dTDP-glucose 4,6-dehydratase [Candidatus Lambdaproteobacteria bacterium RIFOXYD1_FULL_56_27]|uniref:dTDP-glucose 4,6-dehydratase n=1 Tax=Candidatus Lambdaproteobacteria bacterium RIFOXYD2_FULL_56_26 TaxID=1817773 RepID=A0A1F6GME2_9PROT|nr:MAG: dTDP-glucose 4,6-dehydratase [Candidatus Lambdaproteobacteria bacterium RIFOXYD2_FULL_56_26]OGH03311.1 MAG: dTDP-glucose 4,6-dehydratase [Candidatus Lambdaproteobacteria bacterium RIFOXYC1_FULL_56_13]OGH09614.1 MAG: dTDP-glucose 4,6-dehydratase [Candidatus Lambdaproteobacteria bacterium RIFOXYD1_FULL_56_27]
MTHRVLVTGGAGFIGSNFLHHLRQIEPQAKLLNLDKLTYAGNPHNLAGLAGTPGYHFVQGDICDPDLVARTLAEFEPNRIVHFAAESHVDRSIDGPYEFVRTNVMGTFNLLFQAKNYWQALAPQDQEQFRFLHVSTDEVYGSLGESGAFSETTPYAPNSPYSASKAGSDHLVRAWWHTYHFPVITTNCSNNYGPYQFPEKLIPVVLLNALAGKPLPIYGDGQNIRDWLYVVDHCRGIWTALEKGQLGETYNIGGNNERTNLQVVHKLCELLDRIRPKAQGSYKDQITYVPDRPGHDRRYAIDATKISTQLGWQPQEDFDSGFEKTLRWYLDHPDWVANVLNGSYQMQRLGLSC